MRPIRFTGLLLVTQVLVVGPGCATMFNGDRQEVKLKVYPPDAAVVVDGHPATPGTLSLAREQQHYIDVTKDGFEARRVTVKQGIDGMFFLNIIDLPFFWVGMLVDAMTGRMNALEPADITVNLDPQNPNAKRTAPAQTSGAQVSTAGFDAKPAGPNADPLSMGGGTKQPAPNSAKGSGSANLSGPKVEDPVAVKPGGPSAVASSARGSADRPKIAHTYASGPQKEWVIAVMTVTTSGKTNFDKSTLSALTDQVRVFLAERGTKVVDRSQQEAAMKGLVAEEKKKSYQACVDASCQVPLGKALAASHILRSTVARFGKACSTNGELIDLKTEVAVAAGSSRTDCNEEDLLYAAESLAEQLVSGSAGKAR